MWSSRFQNHLNFQIEFSREKFGRRTNAIYAKMVKKFRPDSIDLNPYETFGLFVCSSKIYHSWLNRNTKKNARQIMITSSTYEIKAMYS